MKDSVIRSNQKYSVIIFIDIQGTFDGVWRPIVPNRLRPIKAPKNIQETITDYLSNRETTLHHDGEQISSSMTKGCPQGAVLGPLLCNVSFNELLETNFHEDIHPFAIADDVAFAVTGDTRREGHSRMPGNGGPQEEARRCDDNPWSGRTVE